MDGAQDAAFSMAGNLGAAGCWATAEEGRMLAKAAAKSPAPRARCINAQIVRAPAVIAEKGLIEGIAPP
jgi:hypothetical protein